MKRSMYLKYSYVFIALTLCADILYQPWALENNRFDLFLPSVAPRFFGCLAVTSLLISYKYSDIGHQVLAAAYIGLGCIIYEAVQPIVGLGTFDIKDVIAPGAATCLIIGAQLLSQRRSNLNAI